MLSKTTVIFGLSVGVLTGAGCVGTSADRSSNGVYRTISVDPRRDTEAAKGANRAGLEHLAKGETEQAADAFGRALTADVEFGPAHNNLGKVYYQQRDWYKAAWEFEYARKLLPKRAEPSNNLGLVLEETGSLDRAVDHYREAVGFDPDVIQYRANLVRALIRRGDRTEEVRSLLRQLLEKDTRPDWLIWARQQQAGISDRSE